MHRKLFEKFLEKHPVKHQQPHIIMSAENPMWDAEEHMSHEDLVKFLKINNIKHTQMQGKYGKPERSVIIHNPEKAHKMALRELASQIGQDSIIESDGVNHKLIYTNGPNKDKYHTGKGTQIFDQEPSDHYSKMSDGTIFQHNFDWGETHEDAMATSGNEGLTKSEKLVHYSPTKGIKRIEPDYHGVRKIGAEVRHGVPEHKLSFYYREGIEPESIVTSGSRSKYTVGLGDKKIYDIHKDHEGIGKGIYQKMKQEAMGRQINPGLVHDEDFKSVFHQALKDKGYHGIHNSGLDSTMSGVVGMFEPMDVEAEHEMKPEDFRRTIAKNETLAKGSWQRRNKYNPQKDEGVGQLRNIGKWQWDVNRESKQNITPIKEGGKQRALNKLHKLTEVRQHPETGEREFLLHRGVEPEKASLYSDSDSKYSKDQVTSWTPDLKTATDFGNKRGKTLSAWVPESKIHHYFPQVGNTDAPTIESMKGRNELKEEFEVAVQPHSFNLVDRDDGKNLNKEINRKFNEKYSDKSRVPAKKLTTKRSAYQAAEMADQFKERKLAASEAIINDIKKGSWQRRHKFNAKEESAKIPEEGAHWLYGSGDAEDRLKIPKIEGNARERALHKLSGMTHTKVNPETGKREFLLHRGIGHTEHKKYINEGKNVANYHGDKRTARMSWTPDHSTALNFSSDPHGNRVISSYISEDDIQHMPLQTGIKWKGTHEPLSNRLKREKEVIVSHNKPVYLAHKEEAFKAAIPHSRYSEEDMGEDEEFPLNTKINQRYNNKLAASETLENDLKKSEKSGVRINPEHGARIADAYEQMKHEPNHPKVKAAYGALIGETKKQFQDMVGKGLKVSRIEDGAENPYKSSKDMHHDIKHNNHLWYFPTDAGFGDQKGGQGDHPMLQDSGINHNGHKMLANDLFRVVHDYHGHHLGGESGFGPKGEHEAYLAHKKMFSPQAGKALATETMGQNNWVNYSKSHGENNRKNPSQTVFAEQKAGLLPDHITNGEWHK